MNRHFIHENHRIPIFVGIVFSLCGMTGVFLWYAKPNKSNWLSAVSPISFEHIRRELESEANWKLVKGDRLSIGVPFLENDRIARDLELIQVRDRSVVFLGSALSPDGDTFLFENAIARISDGSATKELSRDTLSVLEDIYRFDSLSSTFTGEYRNFLHNTSAFFRHKDVTRVMIVDSDNSRFQVILFFGEKSAKTFGICEVYSNQGRGIARIKFTSALDDIDWILDSVATIKLNGD